MNVASIQAKLKQYSKAHHKIHHYTLMRYFQERLLYRLSQSDYKDNFLLKGTICTPEHPIFKKDFYENENRLKQWNIFLRKNELRDIDFEEIHDRICKFLQPIYHQLIRQKD